MYSTEDLTDLDLTASARPLDDDDSETEDTCSDPPEVLDTEPPPNVPRVLYIDREDDLAALLDRVEETGTPAIVVLPEGARAVRGLISARLLKRRADAAGIMLAAVTTGRVTIAQFTGVGIPCAPTVGEARLKLGRLSVIDHKTARTVPHRRAPSSSNTAPDLPVHGAVRGSAHPGSGSLPAAPDNAQPPVVPDLDDQLA
ncbi:MAG: hypothetical protein ACRDG4_00190, partial [Chloroflexota bacterium]